MAYSESCHDRQDTYDGHNIGIAALIRVRNPSYQDYQTWRPGVPLPVRQPVLTGGKGTPFLNIRQTASSFSSDAAGNEAVSPSRKAMSIPHSESC